MIYVDVHEPDELIETIEEFGDTVEPHPLGAGDILVRDRLIERKEYGDFLNRLGDDENGIFMQMQRVIDAADGEDLVPVLLLEGDAEAALRWGSIGLHELVGAIAGVHKMGASLMVTPDRRATAQFVLSLETSGTGSTPQRIRDTPSIPEELMPQYLAQGFTNVGAATAEKLLDHFGTFHAIVNADVDELQEVHGVGEKTAERLYRHCRMTLDE